MTRLTALADDLTGANGLAGRWAGRGSSVSVARRAVWLRDEAACRVLDVETRLLPAAQAKAQVAAGWIALGSAGLCFQKVDSTLRGNPGAELEGFLLATTAPWVAVLPAYPGLGRHVSGKAVWVHGRRLDRSEYARDPLTPAKVWRVPDLLPQARWAHAPLSVVSSGAGALRAWLRRVLAKGRPRLVGFDCVEAAHTRTIAQACLAEGCRHFAGAADLGGALAARVLGPASRVQRPRVPWTILAGSVSETTFSQLRAWRDSGGFWEARIRRDLKGSLRPARVAPREAVAAEGTDGCAALSSLERREDLAPWRGLQARLGLDAARCADEALAGLVSWGLAASGGVSRRAWFVTGGHTLRAFDDAAGFRVFRVLGEVLPEVPLGRAEGPSGPVWLCSKPGGFGGADCFVRFMGVR